MNLSHRSVLLVAVALVAAGLSIDCSRQEPVPFDIAGRIAPSGVPVMSELPPFTLTDESGKPFGTNALRGHVWVADFIFTRCESICPMMTAQMKNLQTELSGDPPGKICGWSVFLSIRNTTRRRCLRSTPPTTARTNPTGGS